MSDTDDARLADPHNGAAFGGRSRGFREPCVFEVDGHRITVYWLIQDNHYQYVQLEQPDGTVWHGWTGYVVGAGLEDSPYGYSTPECEATLWRQFQRPAVSAAAVANSIAVGAGWLIKGSLMEQELRTALGLKPNELAILPRESENG